MDGLRVYFDFTLSSLLLYNMERDQYDKVMDEVALKHKNEVKTEEQFDNSVSGEISGKKNDNTLDKAKEKSEAIQSTESMEEKSADESKGSNKSNFVVMLFFTVAIRKIPLYLYFTEKFSYR